MNKLTWKLTALLALAGSACGQIVPKEAALTEGDFYSGMPAAYGLSRIQFAEGELKGKSIQLRQVGFRLDHSLHYGSKNGMGRSWKRVLLRVSDCLMAGLRTSFAKNAYNTPTTVFDAKLTWPTLSTGPLPGNEPSAFGKLYRFAFKKPYAYTGQRGLLLDWTFAGGKLANGGAWVTQTGSWFRAYNFDGTQGQPAVGKHYSTSVYLPPVRSTSGCNDSAIVGGKDAVTEVDVFAYGAKHALSGLVRKTRMAVWSQRTAPGASVVHAVGLAGHLSGVPIGGACKRLYVDFQAFHLLANQVAGNDPDATTAQAQWVVPSNPRHTGLRLWGQTAWLDSSSGGLSLTNAVFTRVPSPPGGRAVQRAAIYRNNNWTSQGWGVGWHSDTDWALPVTKYN